MVLLQNKLNLRVSQKQILTPGLVQMVSVLALNKLELREMINTEMVENPVLEELDSSVPLLDEVAGREEAREREAAKELQDVKQEPSPEADKKDPFDEIDFGSFFRDYLDPGFRSSAAMEEIDRPSFDNFLSKPGTLTDHLMWQLGSVNLSPESSGSGRTGHWQSQRRRISLGLGRRVAGGSTGAGRDSGSNSGTCFFK